MEKSKYLTLQTREGCKRLMALLIAIIVLSGFFAALISSDGGKIKIESICIDARGAELSGDLYYPAGTTDMDSYPATIIVPGAGVIKENMRIISEELARRGYVVLNLNPYGSGLSETPVYNENDMGVEKYDIFATPMGVLDAVHFLRSLEFVDDTRIGLCGHSQGSRRSGYAALMDCGYYTFNDVLLNLLHDSFGVTITAEDIEKDADEIAAARLAPEALAIFKQWKEDYKADYDSMVRSICLIGSTAQYCNPTATVQVAGIDVTRTCKTNQCVINGTYDYSYLSFNTAVTTKEAWYIDPAEDIVNEGYYALDDITGTSKLIGTFRKDTILNNSELKEAIENRSLRIVMQSRKTHSKNFFSYQTAARVIDYFNQTLKNNPEKASTSTGEMVSKWREAFNLIAMLAMLGLLIPVIQLFMLDERYAGISSQVSLKADEKETPNWARWLVFILAVVAGFISIYSLNSGKNLLRLSSNLKFPLMITAWSTVQLIVWLALTCLAMLLIYLLVTRRFLGFWEFVKSNFRIGIKNILRCVIISVSFIFTAYLMLSVSKYLFQQDFRWWMTAYAELKANHWLYVFNYAVLMLPFFFLISNCINYLSNETLGSKKTLWDVVITVLVNSLGIWLCCAINAFLLYSGLKTGSYFSNFILTYGSLLNVPINAFIMRRSYKLTKNIWTGVIICSLMTAWSLVSISGMNGMYIPQSWLSIFLGR